VILRKGRVPLIGGRPDTPEQTAHRVRYLSTDLSSHLTVQIGGTRSEKTASYCGSCEKISAE